MCCERVIPKTSCKLHASQRSGKPLQQTRSSAWQRSVKLPIPGFRNRQYSRNMRMHMKHTTPRQSLRIAGFLFVGAVALMAQSPANNPEPAEVELIALNAMTVPYPPATASIVANSQPQSLASGKSASSETVIPAQPATQFKADDLFTKAPAPGTSTLAMAQDYTANSSRNGSSRSWFTAGPNALPARVRMDPSFGLASSQYGVAPAAVQFSFGKK